MKAVIATYTPNHIYKMKYCPYCGSRRLNIINFIDYYVVECDRCNQGHVMEKVKNQ